MFIEHTADTKFQAFGKSIEEVFANSFKATMETICGNIQISKQEKKQIEVKGIDIKSLLYNFLEEFLFLLDAENFLTESISNIKIDNKNFILNAEAVGDKASNYKFINSVKAVTYSEMFIKKEKNKYTAQVVLDI